MDGCWKLRVARGQPTPPVTSQPSHNKNVSPSEWDHVPQTSSQQPTASANTIEWSENDAVEEVPATEDEGYPVVLVQNILRIELCIILFIYIRFWH